MILNPVTHDDPGIVASLVSISCFATKWRTHPTAIWYTNQFELPCCKEMTRSTVIMFVKETFRLLLTMLIVTLSFTNGFIIIKISDDLPSYLLQSSSTYQRWRQCVSIVGEYSQENSPASKCKDNAIACVRGIRKFSWPTPTANHCRYEEKLNFFVAVLCSPAPIGEKRTW